MLPLSHFVKHITKESLGVYSRDMGEIIFFWMFSPFLCDHETHWPSWKRAHLQPAERADTGD